MSSQIVGRRSFLAQAGALALASALPLGAQERKRPPNVVLIYTDDQGYGDAACYGADYPTPNLDRLAREGVRFTDYYSPYASCSPSRAGMLTGCYPPRVSMNHVLAPRAGIGLNPDETTIASMLKPLGYATACVGKWHVGDYQDFLPTKHGFDEYFGLPYSNDMWPVHYDGTPRPKKNYPPLPLIDGEKVIETIDNLDEQAQLTTRYTERAVDFIRRNSERPFFLYLPHSMVHVPIAVSDKFKGKSGKGLFGDVVMELDWSVGQILKTLEDVGQDDNTLVIYTSDNGPWLNFGNHAGSVGPLRGGKGNTFDGGQREIGLMRWPGRIPAGLVQKEPASSIDLLPTIAEITGASLPERKIDGLSIWPLMRGEPGATCPHEGLLFYYGSGQLQAIRSGRWKLHLPHSYRSYEGVEPGKDGFPGKYSQGKIGLALFDLRAEIGERTNVADAHPEVVERLQALAKRMNDEIQQNKRPPGRRPGAEPEKIVPVPMDPKPIAANAGGEFVCPARQATIGNANGARYVESQYRKNIGNWHSPETVVSWQLMDVPAGRYRVLVRQALEHPLAGGEYEVAVGGAKVRGKVKTTPTWREYVDSDAGVVDVPERGGRTLSIRGVKLSSDRCFMNLHSLRLVPVE
jgi:arylsulfatase A-like enzyme